MDLRAIMSSLALPTLLVLVLGFTPPTEACSCLPTSEQESFCYTDSVLLGNITEVEHLDEGPVMEYYIYHVDVIEVFKGHPATDGLRHIRIESSAYSGLCGLWMEVGYEYLIESYYNEDVLSTNLCTNTVPWESVEEPVKQRYLTGEFEENCIFYEVDLP